MRRVRLSPELVEQIESYAAGERVPAEPRDAATVLLLRDGARGVEAYFLRRQTSMAFAAGMYVYPGGSVDPRDLDADVAWVGPSPSEWSALLGVPARESAALVCAAVRETFEESGVLLAGPSADEVVVDVTGAEWEADRRALEAHELSFTDFLARRRLALRSDLLCPWAGWVTPVFEPRRYRTWFFVAALPAGQRTRDVSTESDRVAWLPLVDALAGADAGELALMPPTYLSGLEVLQHASVSTVLEAATGRHVDMFTPTLNDDGDGPVLSVPPDARPLLEVDRG